MSSFRRLFKSLRAEVRAARHEPLFEDARRHQEALGQHLSVASVLGLLSDDGPERYAERDALTLALIAEQRRAPCSLWASVLLIAYFPMLSRLRHRIWGDALPGEDLDQLVVLCFLKAVEEYPLDRHLDRTALRLRQRTERLVFQRVRREQRSLERQTSTSPEVFEELCQGGWPEVRDEGHPGPRNASDAADMISLLVELTGDSLDGETFDLLTATLVCGRRIPAFIERLHLGLSPEVRARVYQRIKRRHSRALQRLRPSLEGRACPRSVSPRLCETSALSLKEDHE